MSTSSIHLFFLNFEPATNKLIFLYRNKVISLGDTFPT